MKQFAKLFETERGQILVKRDAHDDGDGPEVRFYFDPNTPGLDICSFALRFPDNDGGDAAADKVFAGVDQEGAERSVFAHMDEIASMFTGSSE